jgi:type IV pilus assembly protein PilB
MNAQQSQEDTILTMLVKFNYITSDVLRDARQKAVMNNQNPLQVLMDSGKIDTWIVTKCAAEASGLETVDNLMEYTVDERAIRLLSRDQAETYKCIPVRIEGQNVYVVMVRKAAGNLQLKDDLQRIVKLNIVPIIAKSSEIDMRILREYRRENEITNIGSDLKREKEAEGLADLASMEVGEDAPIVRYVLLFLQQAIQDGASDIHVEPTEHSVQVRYRIDGVLKSMPAAPKEIQAGVISRLKIMADIDIAERRRPQDGRLSAVHSGKKIDFRVATIPTVWGEKIVMRILDNSTAQMRLSDLGFSPNNYERFSLSFTKPYGMILVTGPTGSGKSTTLYATLNILNRPEVNIMTVEDPVEYRLEGINQCQVNVKAGMTFSAALRSMLRCDPDIVLLGEIRDGETAQIATEAALTGHLVLSTLHTNDAPSSIPRITEMGIEPFLVGSAVDCILAQRLARRLCSTCKERYTPTVDELTSTKFPFNSDEPLPEMYRPVGCARCASTGYKGRLALHEVMRMSDEIERLAVTHGTAEEIGKVAREQGMTTLRDDGFYKVLQGTTSIQEILRVVA